MSRCQTTVVTTLKKNCCTYYCTERSLLAAGKMEEFDDLFLEDEYRSPVLHPMYMPRMTETAPEDFSVTGAAEAVASWIHGK